MVGGLMMFVVVSYTLRFPILFLFPNLHSIFFQDHSVFNALMNDDENIDFTTTTSY